MMAIVTNCILPSKKVKQSHYRPWQALRSPGVWGSQVLRQSAHECGKDVSLTHRPPLPQEMFLVIISVDPRVIVRPEGLCQLKIPVTLSGIDPATFRFVAQCLNQFATTCPILPSRMTSILEVFYFITLKFNFYYFALWPTNAHLSHKWSHSYMYGHYRVILRELAINVKPSYASISKAEKS
jgi:hypothetical protein